jgi:hypothetical protein
LCLFLSSQNPSSLIRHFPFPCSFKLKKFLTGCSLWIQVDEASIPSHPDVLEQRKAEIEAEKVRKIKEEERGRKLEEEKKRLEALQQVSCDFG